MMEFVFRTPEGRGFFSHHCYEDEEDEFVVSHGEDLSERVTVYSGGGPWDLPVSFFCEREEALEIVKSILEGGRRPEENWECFEG